jgi:hypothetical protein
MVIKFSSSCLIRPAHGFSLVYLIEPEKSRLMRQSLTGEGSDLFSILHGKDNAF